MKARTSGSGRTGCKARQHSDQMTCDACALAYDVNDADPPDCNPMRLRTPHDVPAPIVPPRSRDKHLETMRRLRELFPDD